MADFINSLDVSTYYEYQGSLTVPPCTEGITYYVIPNIKSLSKIESEITDSTKAVMSEPWR